MACKSFKYYFYVWMSILCGVMISVEAQKSKVKKKRRSKASQKGTGGSVKGIWWTVWIFLLCLLPPLVIFLQNLWRDPMTPTLFANGIELLKEKMLGFLGKSREDAEKDKARKMR
jgi:hypothetical protein